MPKSMLVADDSVVIQKSIGITFAQEDFNITYVNNGEDAVAKARQLKPDLVLADIQMPKMDGYTVCQHLRSDPNLAKTPVLLLAGTHEPFDEAKGKACGANGYVIKPFESQTIIDRVKEMLSGKVAPMPPRPAPATTPSPASTIAAQSPLAAPKPVVPAPQATSPSPASTMAAMSPSSPTPTAAEFDASFDFSVEESSPAEAPVIDASSVTASPSAEATESLPAGDFWDFSEPSGAAPAPAVAVEAPAAVEAAPEENPFELSPTVEFVSPTEPVAVPEPPAAAEFDLSGQDFSAPETSAPSSVPAEPTEFSPAPEFAPEPTVYESAPEPAANPPANGSGLHLSNEQMEEIVAKVFKQVIERIAWEVVPDLAETIIKEELARLTQDKS